MVSRLVSDTKMIYMKRSPPTVKEIYWIGPRKVVRVSRTAMVVLGKEFMGLIGKKVMLAIQVLEEEGEKG